MAAKVFVVVSSADEEVVAGVGLRYSLNAAKNRWLDEVKVIIFGPAGKLVACNPRDQEKIKELQEAGVEVMACKACTDEQNISSILEGAGIKVLYVGSIISQLLKDGWASLTF